MYRASLLSLTALAWINGFPLPEPSLLHRDEIVPVSDPAIMFADTDATEPGALHSSPAGLYPSGQRQPRPRPSPDRHFG